MMSNAQLKEFTITKISGIKFGGKFRNEAAARTAHSFGRDAIVSIEEAPLFTHEEDEELKREKLQHMSR